MNPLHSIQDIHFNTVNASIATFEIGNFVNITNAYQLPDITAVSGETTAYKTHHKSNTRRHRWVSIKLYGFTLP